MIQTHKQFWTEWAEDYRGFSEMIEPYRDAQRDLARAAVAALGDGAQCESLVIIDVGGGTGNIIRPLLDALVARRGHLKKVTYILTDTTEAMEQVSNKRLEILGQSYPDVVFRVLDANTLDDDFTGRIGECIGDVVINSWNIEYYLPAQRQKIVNQLVGLACQDGVVAFSSMVRLPRGVTVRKVLMPLGRAQVVHALLTGGLGAMTKVITSLNKIAQFGAAASSADFPEKPTLAELLELAKQAGLTSVWNEYHLCGVSTMVVGRKDGTAFPVPLLPQPAIAKALADSEGYADYPETVTFRSYLAMLRERGA